MQQEQEIAEESVLVLLAPGFEESQVVHYTSTLRKNKIPVSVVGLSSRHVNGTYGLAIQPDYSLNQLPSNKNYRLILITGGYNYLASLMADPRVHKLLDNTLQHDGYIAADETAESIIPYTNAKAILNGDHFLTPKKMSRDEYTQKLISLVKHSPLPS